MLADGVARAETLVIVEKTEAYHNEELYIAIKPLRSKTWVEICKQNKTSERYLNGELH